MNRRRFLQIGAGLAATACIPGRALGFDSPLLAACRQGAAARGYPWKRAAPRVAEELAEYRHVGAEAGLLRTASRVCALRRDGVVFAPSWGFTGSSFVAYFLGLTELDPLSSRVTMDVVRPWQAGMRARLAIAVEARHAERFVRELTPQRYVRTPMTVGGPSLLECTLDGVDVLVLPMAEIERVTPQHPDDWCGWVLERPLAAFLDAYAPRNVTDLALGLTIFSPTHGLVLTGEEILAARRSGHRIDSIGPDSTYGFLLYREDALALLMTKAGTSRMQAVSMLRALGRKREEEVVPVVRRLRQVCLSDEVINCLVDSSGRLQSKAHARAMAVMMRSPNPLLRHTAWAYATAACGYDNEWAQRLAEAAS